MYFYNPTKTLEENLKGLINDYNRTAGYTINDEIININSDLKNAGNIDYVAMMTDVDIPTED